MQVENVTIRPATIADAKRMAKIHADAWQVTYRHLVPDSFLARFTYDKRTQAFSAAVAKQSEESYLAELGDCVVGILTIGPNRDADLGKTFIGEIWRIYLNPAYWRRGIGTSLVKAAEAKLLARGYNELVLWVFRDNWQARTFYEKLGYLPDGKERIHNVDGEVVAIRCRKKFYP